MDFRVKCALQQIFSYVPGGRHLNYLMQRYVTRTLPLSDDALAEYRLAARRHLDSYRHWVGGTPQSVLELGSGQHLASAIFLALEGCPSVRATDVKPNARPALVKDVLRRLKLSALEDIGVAYSAPYRGQHADRFDMIISDSVLEHVRREELPGLLRSCREQLKPRGICSFSIDYGDHWAQFDSSLTRHNYMKFSAGEWRLYNPPLQYQNRLRHSDYEKLFADAGLAIVSSDLTVMPPPQFRLAEEFRSYTTNDLSVVAAYFVLSPK